MSRPNAEMVGSRRSRWTTETSVSVIWKVFIGSILGGSRLSSRQREQLDVEALLSIPAEVIVHLLLYCPAVIDIVSNDY